MFCNHNIQENHFRTARNIRIYITVQSLLMSETFYSIAQRAKSERQIIRRSQFSKSLNCGFKANPINNLGNFSADMIIVC